MRASVCVLACVCVYMCVCARTRVCETRTELGCVYPKLFPTAGLQGAWDVPGLRACTWQEEMVFHLLQNNVSYRNASDTAAAVLLPLLWV